MYHETVEGAWDIGEAKSKILNLQFSNKVMLVVLEMSFLLILAYNSQI